MDTVADFEAATLAVLDGEDFVPGYFQVYCEGAAMRHMGLNEPYDRLDSVFFKNLALGKTGEQLAEVEAEVKEIILSHVEIPKIVSGPGYSHPGTCSRPSGFQAATSNTPCSSRGKVISIGNMRTMRTGASTSSASSRTFPSVAPAPTPAAR